ncbi:MAG: pentapeptide repeat-containing protein [Haloechinothrix sp.]
METRAVRDLTILLPGDQPGDLPLLNALPSHGDAISGRRVTGQVLARVHVTDTAVRGCWLTNADLSGARFESASFDRCVFRGSTLIGAHLTDVVLKNVIFENCRLDYASINRARTLGPTAFLGCSLAETAIEDSTFTQAALDNCNLTGLALDTTDLRGADLRGNDLAAIAGITNIRGATISDHQLPGISEALVRDLELMIKTG